ncbi:MAG: exosortase system-associated protein, TIGR04073 family [Candidatus Omnitrophica bacterium]|nr:exosortase system-associated protein, TIGR04073 family [Candidatus Omnitrophota bacterium]
MIYKHILTGSIIFFLLTPASSFAENSPPRKFNRGVINIVTAPVEIPKQTKAYWHEGGKITAHISFWLFSGMVKGVVNTITRAASGIWDATTFPLEKPGNYESLIKPDSVFEGDNITLSVYVFQT